MASIPIQTSGGVPAHSSFLAIYNPSLGPSEESRREQIVFYSASSQRARHSRYKPSGPPDGAQDHGNEEMRQVGLAQGMVNFAKNFSDGQSINSIETEKSRIVLHELEQGWWILASIDLTQLPSSRGADGTGNSDPTTFEYSSREVSPPQLLLQNLLRAHSIFLLHHGPTLDGLYSQMPRPRFCTLLHRFWTRFLQNWDVLLHGNPGVDIYNGVKLAGGGELGIGVGEEEWGSGEREVLEDFIRRTPGLVELMVCRYGDATEEPCTTTTGQKSPILSEKRYVPWHDGEFDPRPSDGMFFSSPGAISRRSLATISQWTTDIYRYGEDAYGVGENPTARPRRKRRRVSPDPAQRGQSRQGNKSAPVVKKSSPSPARAGQGLNDPDDQGPGIPPPLVKAVEQSLEKATAKASSRDPSESPPGEQQGGMIDARGRVNEKQVAPLFDTDKMMKYLSLGYGSSWTIGSGSASRDEPQIVSGRSSELRSPETPGLSSPKLRESGHGVVTKRDPSAQEAIGPAPQNSAHEDQAFVQRFQESIGRFLIGLSGGLENQGDDENDPEDGSRVSVRTLTVEMHHSSRGLEREDSAAASFCSRHRSDGDLAGLEAEAVSSRARSIHHQLGPLQKPLLRSTDPAKVAARISNAMGQGRTTSPAWPSKTPSPPIYDLIYDPEKLTVHGSLPNIPTPQASGPDGLNSPRQQTVSGSWYTLGIPTSSSSSPASRTTSPLRSKESRGRSNTSTSTNANTNTNNSPAPTTGPGWTRAQALNVHTQILNSHAAARRAGSLELERCVQTSRGWWVLWMRVQGRVNADADDSDNIGLPKEAILVRRARDESGPGSVGVGPRWPGRQVTSGLGWLVRDPRREREREFSGSGGGGGVAGVSAAAGGSGSRATSPRMASVSEGVGVDARRWVEGLLSLSR